jgi:hypothetical protein
MLGLAPDGGCLAGVSPRRRWSLAPPFHPRLCDPYGSKGQSVSVALSASRLAWALPSIVLCGARTFLTSHKCEARPPGPLGQNHLSTRTVPRQAKNARLRHRAVQFQNAVNASPLRPRTLALGLRASAGASVNSRATSAKPPRLWRAAPQPASAGLATAGKVARPRTEQPCPPPRATPPARLVHHAPYTGAQLA